MNNKQVKFRVGQKVRLVNNTGMGVPCGSAGIVESVELDELYGDWLRFCVFLNITWLNNNYNTRWCRSGLCRLGKRFEPIHETGKQMEFNFMHD